MRLALSSLLVGLLVTGCAGNTSQPGWSGIKTPFVKPVEQISVPTGEFAIVYKDMAVAYALLASNVVALCKAKALTPESCAVADKAKDRIEQLSETLENQLRNPGVQVDWIAVGKAIRTISALAISLGVPGGSALVKIPEVLDKVGGAVQDLKK